jgi:hypothetical protein
MTIDEARRQLREAQTIVATAMGTLSDLRAQSEAQPPWFRDPAEQWRSAQLAAQRALSAWDEALDALLRLRR